MKVGYSRISDVQQAVTGPLESAEAELRKAGDDLVLLEIGSGRSDTDRPQFRKLRELILDGKVSTLICPSQDRLYRNTEELLKFVQLCQMQKVKIHDLNGRELEIKTADGKLMATVIGALDAHRSDLYSEKVRRHMTAAKEAGFPVRSKVPFGLMKIRNEGGRVTTLDIDPITGPLARQRVDWFLKENLTIVALVRRIAKDQPDHPMSRRHLGLWLSSPLLTGRLAWGQDKSSLKLTAVNDHQSFPALITDAEHEAIVIQLAAASKSKGRRGLKPRMFSGIVRCKHCGNTLTYKTHKHASVEYLRCNAPLCEKSSRNVSTDLVFSVLQYSLGKHAVRLAPLLDRPKTDAPEVVALKAQIETLRGIPGTEAVIHQKQAEIRLIRTVDHETPAWLLIGVMRNAQFWLQPDEKLNQVLRLFLNHITVDLRDGVRSALVTEVNCRTSPADAPLPPDQRNIEIHTVAEEINIAKSKQEEIEQILQSIL